MRDTGLNVLSLFDGAGTLRLALQMAGVEVGKYYASEIKPFAIDFTSKKFQDIIHLGDIRGWKSWDIDWGSIDLIGSGSPCQDLSIAGKRKGIYGTRSSLFFIFVEILNYVKKFNPDVKFLQENVCSPDKKDLHIITKNLGIYPQMINSNIFVPQNRCRLYWSNIKVKRYGLFGFEKTNFNIPTRKTLMIANDILTRGAKYPKRHFPTLTERYIKANNYQDYKKLKIRLLTKSAPYAIEKSGKYRILNKIEISRLQGFPDDYFETLDINKAGSLLGDAWTLPVIVEFMKQLKQKL